MREDEIAARGHVIPERRDDLGRILVIGHEMQDGDHQYRDGLRPVDQPGHRRVVNDVPGAT